MIWIAIALLAWLGGWALIIWLSRRSERSIPFLVAAIFGAALLLLWEGLVRGLDVPLVILPAPSQIWEALTANVPTL